MMEFGLVIPKETDKDTTPVEVVKKNSNSHPKVTFPFVNHRFAPIRMKLDAYILLLENHFLV
jgi:hypothetical protein